MEIIVTNKLRKHMECHADEFIEEWEKLLKKLQREGAFSELINPFEILQIDTSEIVGVCSLHKTDSKDDIIYAKRKGRDIYTRFVKGKQKQEVNSIVVILKQNAYKPEEYYVVTAYPGFKSCKEPQDSNIKDKGELKECLAFWRKHALVYDESMIDTGSITDQCPWDNLIIEVVKY